MTKNMLKDIKEIRKENNLYKKQVKESVRRNGSYRNETEGGKKLEENE